jgi:DNA-binding LytR/AlgR family response regulator
MTTPLRAVIADDEPLSLQRLELGLGRIADLEVVGAAKDGEEARALIRALTPDLVLLDIHMPQTDGLDLAAALHGAGGPQVIFVTAFARHAAKAFDLDAVDYVLKPLKFDRLTEAVERARDRITARTSVAKLAEMSAALEDPHRGGDVAPPGFAPELWANERSGRVRVPIEQVVWIQAEREYVRIHGPGRSYLLRRALGELAGQLDPAQFMRVHRSILVSRGRIESVVRRESGGLTAILTGGVELPVGRKYRAAVCAQLGM